MYVYNIIHYSFFVSLRENLLTREIEDLKSKLMTKTVELDKAIKRNSEVCILL